MTKSLLLLLLSGSVLAGVAARADETERFGRFGDLVLYRESPHPSHFVLFVSGDGGWNLGVIDMAKSLASLDALVVGIDIRTYLAALRESSESCLDPASDFEALSHDLQKKLGFEHYTLPVLVGYSSGATLVYAAAAQAPPNIFRGAISLAFCPDLEVPRSFCRGSRLTSNPDPKGKSIVFDPIDHVVSPWIVFQGEIDQVCNADEARRFVGRVEGGELVSLPKVGHGFSIQRNWMPQFRAAFARMTSGDASAGSQAAGK